MGTSEKLRVRYLPLFVGAVYAAVSAHTLTKFGYSHTIVTMLSIALGYGMKMLTQDIQQFLVNNEG